MHRISEDNFPDYSKPISTVPHCVLKMIALSTAALRTLFVAHFQSHIVKLFFYCCGKLHLYNTHTYTYNWPLQPFCQDYGLASHTTHVVCVNFIGEWRDLQFNVDSERQIFWETFHGSFNLLSQILPGKIADEIYFFFVFRFDSWRRIRTRAIRLISQQTTYSTIANTHNF